MRAKSRETPPGRRRAEERGQSVLEWCGIVAKHRVVRSEDEASPQRPVNAKLVYHDSAAGDPPSRVFPSVLIGTICRAASREWQSWTSGDRCWEDRVRPELMLEHQIALMDEGMRQTRPFFSTRSSMLTDLVLHD
jgi:hypothetical protein